uniref:Uncharacterized protein n=2 Tax=Gasterosteus aculeatus aculeatus TaxID=481459 RepID=A0AAQ4QG92_GASAC
MPTLTRAQKRCWSIQTAGRWPWKSEPAKECVTTHLPKWRRVPCEQQLNMGQSVLRDGRTPFGRAGRWPTSPPANRKGAGFRFPDLEWRRQAPRGAQCGDANDSGEAGGSPGKSSLFFVKGRAPLEWVRPERGARALGKRRASGGVPVSSRRPLKIRRRGCKSRARPYPYPQQVSKVNSLWHVRSR